MKTTSKFMLTLVALASSRVGAVISAPFFSGFVFGLHIMETPIGSLPGWAFHHAWRTLCVHGLQAFYHGCGWYQWVHSPWYYKGCSAGKARWFWREPKNPRWVYATSFVYGFEP